MGEVNGTPENKKAGICDEFFRQSLPLLNTNNSHHLARKYARIFVHRQYLFQEANSFPRAKL